MSTPIFEYMRKYNHKKIVFCSDPNSGLRAIIAIHSTDLGPAVGGLRMWPYPSEEDAIFDALRLARGMTYKYAAAGLNFGGGKAVIVGDPKRQKSEALLRAYARFVEQLGGEYITGEDVGTTLADMEVIFHETKHIVTLPTHCGGAGDIAPATALGSVAATKACAKRVWGTDSLKGRSVALQGLGAVGSQALRLLVKEGAKVLVADLDSKKVESAIAEFGVKGVPVEDIYQQKVDIFAPYALGAVINDYTIPQLQVKVVAGSANNIFEEERHGDELERLGIVYAVDYIANAGGTIYDTDRLRRGGFQPERAWANVARIYDRIEQVFQLAECHHIPCYIAADRLAEERIAALRSTRLLTPEPLVG